MTADQNHWQPDKKRSFWRGRAAARRNLLQCGTRLTRRTCTS